AKGVSKPAPANTRLQADRVLPLYRVLVERVTQADTGADLRQATAESENVQAESVANLGREALRGRRYGKPIHDEPAFEAPGAPSVRCVLVAGDAPSGAAVGSLGSEQETVDGLSLRHF